MSSLNLPLTSALLPHDAGHMKNLTYYCPALAWAPAPDNKKVGFLISL